MEPNKNNSQQSSQQPKDEKQKTFNKMALLAEAMKELGRQEEIKNYQKQVMKEFKKHM